MLQESLQRRGRGVTARFHWANNMAC